MSGEPMEFGDGEDLGGEIKKVDLPPPPPPPPPPPVERDEVDDPDPISEIDPDFVIARAHSSNAQPVYPEKMRHKGVEAEIVLRVRISASGEVIKVDLVRGDEPFAAAAIAAVETWRYSPATDAGKAVVSTRLVKIPFRLQGSK
jgi:TonB family protein